MSTGRVFPPRCDP